MKSLRLLGYSLAAMALAGPSVRSEDMTLTTYYPSPRGVYELLQSRSFQDFDNTSFVVDPDQSTTLNLLTVSGMSNLDGGLTAPSGTINTLTGTTLNYNTGNIDTANGTTLNYNTGNIDTANGTTLNYNTGNIDTANGTTLNYDTGNIDTANGTTLNYDTGNIDTANGTTLNYDTGNIDTANGTTLNYDTGNIDTVNGTTLNFNPGTGHIGTLDGNSLDYTSGEFDALTVNGDVTITGSLTAAVVHTPSSEAVTLDSNLTGVGNISANGDVSAVSFSGGTFNGSAFNGDTFSGTAFTGGTFSGSTLTLTGAANVGSVDASGTIQTSGLVSGATITGLNHVGSLGTITAASDITSVTGAVKGKSLTATSSGANIAGGLTVTGGSTLGGGSTLNGGATVNGTLTVNGNAGADSFVADEGIQTPEICFAGVCKKGWPTAKLVFGTSYVMSDIASASCGAGAVLTAYDCTGECDTERMQFTCTLISVELNWP